MGVMSRTTGRHLGMAVLKTLGLEGRLVKHITLDLDAREPARITVEEYLTNDQEAAAIRVFELTEWKEVTE